ncbi:MAG: hypothetical protein AB1647_03890 [Pseudomonadota bacterium]
MPDMNVLSYPLRYLTLKDEDKHALFRRNGLAVFLVAAFLTLPFLLPGANYFGDDGFLDRFGSVAAVLTGFYVAALVGIASFPSSLGDLDDVMEVGKVFGRECDDDGNPVALTRRQYVCAMFGYLAFMCLSVSTAAVLLVVVTDVTKSSFLQALPDQWTSAAWFEKNFVWVVRAVFIGLLNLAIAHMIVTTFHGLYYLIERLYDKKPELLPKAECGSQSGPPNDTV